MKRKKPACEAETPICSGALVRPYGVNGSEKEGITFQLCGPCAVMIKRSGSRLKAV